MSAGLKQGDLRPCSVCRQGVMHAGSPMFYRLTLETFVIDMNAVRRQHGLEMHMGGAAPLAAVMGPNEDMAKRVGTAELVICLSCAMERSFAGLLASIESDAHG